MKKGWSRESDQRMHLLCLCEQLGVVYIGECDKGFVMLWVMVSQVDGAKKVTDRVITLDLKLAMKVMNRNQVVQVRWSRVWGMVWDEGQCISNTDTVTMLLRLQWMLHESSTIVLFLQLCLLWDENVFAWRCNGNAFCLPACWYPILATGKYLSDNGTECTFVGTGNSRWRGTSEEILCKSQEQEGVHSCYKLCTLNSISATWAANLHNVQWNSNYKECKKWESDRHTCK